MNIERMTHAIALLRDIKPEQWDYGSWAEDLDLTNDVPLPTCGTTACAAGWMGLDPVCNSQGFRLADCDTSEPYFEGYFGVHAVDRYLEISEHDARSIFIDLEDALEEADPDFNGKVTPAHVADALQALLDKELANV